MINLFKSHIKHYLSLISLLIFAFFTIQASPLAENSVFKLTPKIVDPNTVVLTWNIKEGNFLYKKRFSFKTSIHQSLGPVNLPSTDVIKKYPNTNYKVYRNVVNIPLYLLNDKAGVFKLRVSHQGCADSGFCYPPTSNAFDIKVNKTLEMVSISKTKKATKTIKQLTKTTNNTSPYQTLFEDHNIFFIILSFYGFGLLLAFTPCVLPMVPVLSGIIVGQHKNITTRRSLLLSISYVLGMSVTYAIVGITIAALGQNLQALFQSPITISIFAILFVILALSMFDFYTLSLPQSWQAKLANRSNKQNSGAYLGAFTMGALSTLILSPCVTAPLVGALTYIAKTSNMALGGFSLLFLGFGMGTPLIIIGASAGKLLPKAGNWMNHIKHLFGVLLLIIAISLAERILPPAITMLFWSILLVVSSIFLGLFNKELDTSRAIFTKGLAIILFGYGLMILLGVAMGNTSPYKPLNLNNISNLQPVSINHINLKPTPIIVDSLPKAKTVIEQAKLQHKKVLVDFYADWCTSCKEMDTTVFNDPKVQLAMKDFIWLKVDITKRNQASKALEKNYNVIAPPTLLFISNAGKEITRIVGETTKEKVIQTIMKD